MTKVYPQVRSSFSHEEMVEHFLLAPAELQLCSRAAAIRTVVVGAYSRKQRDPAILFTLSFGITRRLRCSTLLDRQFKRAGETQFTAGGRTQKRQSHS
jgi:hypothetical protein